MPAVTIQAGARIHIPDGDEMRGYVKQALIENEREMEHARGFKWLRIPELLSGKPASNAITLGTGSGQGATPVGPEQGYAWSLLRVVVSGLTAGTTPDVVNLFRNDRFSGPPLWQFTGNALQAGFAKLGLVLMGGDTLSLQNVGSIASTSLITVSGELVEVPAEMLYKLI